MGMWDKDREIGQRPEDVFGLDTPFVLSSAEIADREITTSLGPASVAVLRGHRMLENGLSTEMTATTVASAIVDKVKQAETDDFPAVVQLQRVDTKRWKGVLVLSFVGPWNGDRAS